MALTKITRGVIKANENYDTHNINSTGIVTAVSANFTGNVSIGGTLTYQDVTNIDSVGVITARAGVNISGGNLQVKGGNLHLDSNAELALFEDNTSGSYTNSAKIAFDFSGNIARMRSSTNGSATIRPLAFYIANTPAIFVGTDGKVGINETSPTAHLVVKQSGNTFTTQSQTVALFQRSSTAGHGAKIAIVAGTGGSSDINFGDTADEDIGSIQYYHTDDSLRFITNTSERLRITDTGMVGINMTPSTTGSSTYMLQMYNAGSQCFMSLGQGSGNGPLRGLVMGVSNAAHYITGRENRPMIFATNDTERLRITNDGKFGFGTSSPSSLLHGEVSSGSAILTLKSTATSGEASVSISGKNSSGTARTGIFKYDNGDMIRLGTSQAIPMRFETSDLERMRIDSSGRVTMPYQPSAMAYNAQGQHMAGNAVAQFNSTRFNIGSMYNSSNGRMTVPVAGRYLVAYSGLHDYISQNAIGFDIRINGSVFNGGEGYQEDSSRGNSQLSKTLILQLSANDYVDIHIRQSGTQVHQRYGSFTVTLLT
jgi:hypothetical protein